MRQETQRARPQFWHRRQAPRPGRTRPQEAHSAGPRLAVSGVGGAGDPPTAGGPAAAPGVAAGPGTLDGPAGLTAGADRDGTTGASEAADDDVEPAGGSESARARPGARVTGGAGGSIPRGSGESRGRAASLRGDGGAPGAAGAGADGAERRISIAPAPPKAMSPVPTKSAHSGNRPVVSEASARPTYPATATSAAPRPRRGAAARRSCRRDRRPKEGVSRRAVMRFPCPNRGPPTDRCRRTRRPGRSAARC